MRTYINKITLTLAALLASLLLSASSGSVIPAGKAFLQQLQKRDSVLIADQLRYGFVLENLPSGTAISLPSLSEVLSDSIVVVSDWQIDTLNFRKKNGDVDVAGYMTIAAFDEGIYHLPDIPIVRGLTGSDPDTLVFEGLELDVRTMPVDTTTFVPHDIKGLVRYPVTLAEIVPYVLLFQLIATIIILIVCIVMVRKQRKQTGESSVREPAFITALRKLDKYRGNKYWEPDKQKLFYSGVTDVLREYIASRYGFGAMEMTTLEIFNELKDKDVPQQILEETHSLFITSDLVKFAKMTASDEENAKAVPSAVRFVTSTWKTEEEKEAENVL